MSVNPKEFGHNLYHSIGNVVGAEFILRKKHFLYTIVEIIPGALHSYCITSITFHNTLIVVGRYLRLVGDKTIPDSAEPRLESFYTPFVACIT